jgi:queuine tRNA-ribosyltransferase
MALAPEPGRRHRYDVRQGSHATADGPLVAGCGCPTCTNHGLAYVHYLARHEELTAVRMLTVHNLAYTKAVVDGARAAIEAGGFEVYRQSILGGRAPWDA